MADINFDCPECGGNLSVDNKCAGMSVSCPLCSKRITIPHQDSKPTPSPAKSPPRETSQPDKPNWKSNPTMWKKVGVSVAVVLVLLWVQRSCHNWQERRAYQEAMRGLNAQMQKESANLEKEEQKRKDAQARAQQAEVESKRQQQEREQQEETARSEKRQQVGQYAAIQFSQFPLTPRLHISPSLGVVSHTVAFRGEEFDKVLKAYNVKDWIRLYALLRHREDDKLVWPEDKEEIDRALYQIENIECFLRFNPNITLTGDDYLLVVLFDRDPKWIEQPMLGCDSIFEYPDHLQKHPSGKGYVYEIRPGKSDMFIIHSTSEKPLHADMAFLQESYGKALQSIRKRRELGELSDAAYTTELLILKKADMRYCSMLLTPYGMHGQEAAPSAVSVPKRYVKGSLSFFADDPGWGTVREKLRQIEETIKLSSSADIQSCLNELDEQLEKYPEYESNLRVTFRPSLEKYLHLAKTREQMAVDKGSLAFLANCRDPETALRNVMRLREIKEAVVETNSTEIQDCINELNEQIKKCPQVRMPSGLDSYEDNLKYSRDSLYSSLADAKAREKRASAEAQEKKWQSEREAAFVRCLAEAKK